MDRQGMKEEKRISVKNILNSTMADDPEKGNQVFAIIKAEAEKGEESILLDFDGIELVNTAFLNNAVGKLFDMAQFNILKCSVKMGGMDDTMIDLLREAIRVARQKYLRT